MAILTGIGSNLRGSAGKWTYARTGGQTVAREKADTKGQSPRTFAQMRNRVQLSNIVNMWRAFEGLDRPSFERADRRVSDYNLFTAANLGIVPVFLTKEEARSGACVVAPYIVTRGTLPSINISEAGGGAIKTSVELGDLVIDANTTLAAFSNAVVSNNQDFAFGDNITCFIARQLTDAATSMPRVVIEESNVTLDGEDSVTMLRDTASAAAFSTVDSALGMSGLLDGGVVYIHSRKTADGTKVSTQRFLVSNAILAQYQSQTKMDEAITSYGGQLKVPYLTPNGNDIEIARNGGE